jgi:hypothetical protein
MVTSVQYCRWFAGVILLIYLCSGPLLGEPKWVPITADGYAVDGNSIGQSDGVVSFWLRSSDGDSYAIQTRKLPGKLREARPFLSKVWGDWQPVPPDSYLSHAIDFARVSLFRPPPMSAPQWALVSGSFSVDPSQIATVNGEVFIYLRNAEGSQTPMLLRFREERGVIKSLVRAADGSETWRTAEDGTIIKDIYEFAIRTGDTW